MAGYHSSTITVTREMVVLVEDSTSNKGLFSSSSSTTVAVQEMLSVEDGLLVLTLEVIGLEAVVGVSSSFSTTNCGSSRCITNSTTVLGMIVLVAVVVVIVKL